MDVMHAVRPDCEPSYLTPISAEVFDEFKPGRIKLQMRDIQTSSNNISRICHGYYIKETLAAVSPLPLQNGTARSDAINQIGALGNERTHIRLPR